MGFPRSLAAGLLLVLSSGGWGGADEWPQWRGPGRDGEWRESGIVERFAAAELKPRWRTPIGTGYSGPSVAGGRVFLTDRATEPQQMERIHCFDWKTGKSLWRHEYDCPYVGVGYAAGPRATPTVDGDRVYSLGAMGHLTCSNIADGQVVWSRALAVEYMTEMPIWGIAAAPLVENDLLIVQIGGKDACLVGLDKMTGQERWKALSDRASYSAPIMIEQAGRRVLVCWTGDSVAGLDPLSGKVHWRHPFEISRMVISVATPVVDRDRIFVSSFYDGSLLLKIDPQRLAVEQLWRRRGPDEQHTDSLHSMISTPLLDGEYIYGVDSYGELRCLNAATGDRVWEDLTATPKARWSTIHTVRNKDRVWMFNERGELVIGRLSPQGFHQISRAKLIEPTTAQLSQRGGVCWSHPAYAHRHVFARNDEELVCASLAAGEE